MSLLGERLEKARKARGWTQYQMSEYSGFSRSAVINWEKGVRSPDAEALNKLAKTLNVSIAYLMGEVDERLSETQGPMEERPRSETAEMFARLMKKLAVENPDLIIHFRDLEKNIDNLSPIDIQAIADGIAMITGKANKDIEKRFKKAQPGDI